MDLPAAADPGLLNAEEKASTSEARACELCGAGATLLCSADQAYLCWDCDATVHGANFLVARHTRSLLCLVCSSVTVRVATGDQPKQMACVCPACQPQEIGFAPVTPEVNELGNGDCREQCLEEPCEVSSASQQGETGGEEVDKWCPTQHHSARPSRKKRSLPVEDVQCDAASRCMSPLSVLSCPRSPYNDTMEEEVQDSEETTKQVTMAHDRCSTLGNEHNEQEETSSSYPPMYGSVPSKRRRCQQATTSRWQDLPQEGVSGDESRVERALSRWHWDLGFSSPRVISMALYIYRRGVRVLRSSQSTGDATRQTLAASLWLAAKLDDEQTIIPGAAEMGFCTGVSPRRLVAAESQLLQMLDWRALEGMLREM